MTSQVTLFRKMKMRKFRYLEINLLRLSKQLMYFVTMVGLLTFGMKFLDTILFSSLLIEDFERIEIISVEGQTRTVRLEAKESSRISQHSPKVILLWTTYFGRNYSKDFYFFEKGNRTFDKYQCPYNHCEVTANKDALETADAILFHAMDLANQKLPISTKINQIKILYNLEAPNNLRRLKWRKFKGFFNWTMTYRSDSSIQVKYGLVLRHPRHISSEQVLERSVNLLKQKSKRAVWFVSNCDTESNREHYVHELQKYYPVDIFGLCGSLNCTPSQSSQCYQRILKQYAFYLSFENSICKDYVTEKFFNILNYDIVPVVFGGANYVNISPPNSYIDAMEYSNPKDLAIYLHKVGNNSALYASFLQWKETFRIHLHPWMCELCFQLVTFGDRQEVLHNPWNWIIGESECKRWFKNWGFRDVCVRNHTVKTV